MKNQILIVEDNLINRNILKKILRNEYEVISADNGLTALEIIKDNYSAISAVILDLVMPKMSGKELLAIMARENKYQNLPVLIATGEHDDALESECLQLGAWDFITKPYNPIVLRLRLHNIIGRSQTHLMQQIQILAERDTLTGLFNRRFFMKKTM
ncbi:MAG: response regulator [Lachnospiraceae bacterium]|nr:response regulator [Lachnospiraceae bacterium]